MRKNRKLIAGIVLIVISSLSCGAMFGYWIGRESGGTDQPSLREIRDDLLALIVRDFKLTPEQRIQAEEILDRGMERMVAFRIKHAPEILMIIKENHQAFRAILNPEQQKEYDAYRREKFKAIKEKLLTEY